MAKILFNALFRFDSDAVFHRICFGAISGAAFGGGSMIYDTWIGKPKFTMNNCIEKSFIIGVTSCAGSLCGAIMMVLYPFPLIAGALGVGTIAFSNFLMTRNKFHHTQLGF